MVDEADGFGTICAFALLGWTGLWVCFFSLLEEAMGMGGLSFLFWVGLRLFSIAVDGWGGMMKEDVGFAKVSVSVS